ncbi:MAG: hypothetical protein IJH47_08865 [Oscillospiraceae bacterium]|nr:hypothetical protein [Oscillospiraceae bacterium]
MSKYDGLWEYIRENAPPMLTFDQIREICGFPVDHSFLTFKKELEPCGYRIGKISLKDRTVKIEKWKPG